MKFTQSVLHSIKPKDKPYWITDEGCANLRLHVAKSGKKNWYAQYRDENNKHQSHKLGPADALTVAQAREMARDVAARVARGEQVKKERPVDKLTLGTYLNDNYFPHARSANKSAREFIRVIIRAFGDCFDKPIEDVTPVLVDKWRKSCRERGCTAATANRAVTYLKAALNYGVKSGLMEKNPIVNISPLKEDDSKYIIRYLSPDERDRLETALIEREKRIRAARESANEWRSERGYETMTNTKGEFVDYLRPAVLLSLCTGIRRGAFFALKWGDIDFNPSAPSVTLLAKDAKSRKTKILPLSDDAIDILYSWRSQSENTAPNDLVFPSPVTGRSIQEIKTAWKNLLRDAKIENFRWHDMRHDFASQLVMKGIDLNTVRELLCHSDMKMTMRYAHLAPKHKLEAVQTLNRRVKGSKIIGRIREASR